MDRPTIREWLRSHELLLAWLAATAVLMVAAIELHRSEMIGPAALVSLFAAFAWTGQRAAHNAISRAQMQADRASDALAELDEVRSRLSAVHDAVVREYRAVVADQSASYDQLKVKQLSELADRVYRLAYPELANITSARDEVRR